MDEIIFYDDWLPLPKKHFRILAMLADQSTFQGTLSDMCKYLSITPQTRNKRSLKESIQWLHQNNFIDYQLTGYTYTIRIIPKGQSIAIPREWLHSIQAHHSSSEAVGWENVVKLLLWYLKCKPDQTVTNAIISNELGVSESTIISSKNVLRNELNAIEIKNVSIKIDDGHFRSVGHIATVFAFWNND